MDATFHTLRRNALRKIKAGGLGRLGVVGANKRPVGGGAPVERSQLTTQGGGGLLVPRSLSQRRAP
jgi:hypothetical protein